MVSPPKKQVLPAVGNMLAPVPGAVAMTDSGFGRSKVKPANTGAAAADDQVMQFNISGTIGARLIKKPLNPRLCRSLDHCGQKMVFGDLSPELNPGKFPLL